MQGPCRLPNALAEGQAAGSAAGGDEEGGCSSKELHFEALGRGWSKLKKSVRKQGKG